MFQLHGGNGFIFPALSPVQAKGQVPGYDLGLSVPEKGQLQALIFSQFSMEGAVRNAGVACNKNKKILPLDKKKIISNR